MSALTEILRRLDCPFDEALVHDYLSRGWVRPRMEKGETYFDSVDVARVRFIYTLRTELKVDDEALPVILSLLDQLHGTRLILRRVASVLASQPDELRAEIASLLALDSDSEEHAP